MTDTTDLLARYKKLSSFEKTILQILSIIYEPAHTTLVLNCLRKLELKSPRGNRPTAANLNHYFSKFEKLELLTENRQCPLEIVETISKCSVKEGTFAQFAEVIRAEAPVSYYYGKWTTRCWRAVREMRIGIYTQEFDLIDESVEFISGQCREIVAPTPPAVMIMTDPFDREWFRELPTSFQFYLLDSVLRYSQANLESYPELVTYLQDEDEFKHLSSDEQLPFVRLLFNQLLFRGEYPQADALVQQHPELFQGTGALGAVKFLQDDIEGSLHAFDQDLEMLRDLTGTPEVSIFGPAGLFYILARLKAGGSQAYPEILHQITITLNNFSGAVEYDSYTFLANLIKSQTNNEVGAEVATIDAETTIHSLTVLFAGLCQYWTNSSLQPELEDIMTQLFHRAYKNNYHFFSLAFADILQTISNSSEEYQEYAEELRAKTATSPLISIIEPEDPWKRNLQALIHVTNTQPHASQEPQIRMAWMIEFKNENLSISPKEQKLAPNGGWSKGRPISLSRLHSSSKLRYLTLQDRKICLAINKVHNPETHGVHYHFDMDKALLAMINHPHLFLAKSPRTPVEFVSGEPELLVEERGDELHIRFAQPISEEKVAIYQETPTRFKIISIDDNHRRIAQITGKKGLTVPKSASEQVLTAIGNISSFMTVHSAIASETSIGKGSNINFVEADSTIYMHLLPYGTGFRLEMFTKPFAEGGHYLKPGQGVENIMAEVNGKRLQTKRDLALEEQKARDIEELCPILDLAIDLEQENDREWHLQDPDDCLQALLELQSISDRVVVEWPEGEKLMISQQASLKNLNLKIRTNRQNWFAMSGNLQLDDNRVIGLKELLAKIKSTSGRFVQIDDGQFLALTQEFKKRLEDMVIYSESIEEDGEEEILIHPLAAMPLSELTQQASTHADAGWKNQLARIAETENFKPELPSTLCAELRDYQFEGFQWLARLSYWGVGGCLADDMGLGKTLQSLSIILKNAADGPTLVVAPTSVSTNWQSEINRFTPTLNIKELTQKNRAETITSLGRFDVLITTYTLLQQESELLSTVQWQTVILDEAQAIKNAATKRSKAAMALQSKFKLLTTGTPIENHLGELWNLFNFINPGLLGSLNRFNERFAIPIERFNDREARLKLKKLIRPFILRRIKSQVLEELPSRTDITLQVEMNDEETHLYEALRQNALDVLENKAEKKGRHLQILTEIMKLRQACCNPRLIDNDTTIPSSKLKVFTSVVEELVGGRHKALVFSQFIGHLRIIREHLDELGISYQYLDGGTTTKERKRRVEAFQAGEGDLFLISLKAGGLGLNLTAADYVLHMDPWWNPAIEDQASDRAHRIGQTRPVTIYRLVCKNSIEEKIVKLHQEKRDLAGSLLEGSDMSAKMSADDLLDLIRER